MMGFGLLPALGAAVKEPGAQREQTLAPLCEAKEPGEQIAHADCAGALEYMPIWHVAQNERPESV
jgi:hypothetical protein